MDAEKELDEYTESHMPPARRRFGLIMKWTFRILVFAIIALIIWRVFIAGHVPADAKTLLVNDATHAAYVAGGETLAVYTHPHDEIVVRETDDGDVGLFWVNQTVFIPAAEQVQILSRVPKSTLKYLAADFSLDAVPAHGERVADVTLLITTDPTPDDTANGDTFTTRYSATAEPVRTLTSMYTYYKYIFDGVVIDETTVSVSVDFYYVGAVDYNADPYASLLIYRDYFQNEPVTLTARDRRALKQYAK